MPIENSWDETFPSNRRFSNNGAIDMRRFRFDVREQLTEGNHRNVADINIEPGAIHIASDSDSEFPIYAEDGSTLKIAGWTNQAASELSGLLPDDVLENFGNGTRLDHIQTRRTVISGIIGGSFQRIMAKGIENNSVYSFHLRILSIDTSGTNINGAVTRTMCYSRAGLGISLIGSTSSQDDSASNLTVRDEQSFSEARVAVLTLAPVSTLIAITRSQRIA